MSRIAQKFFVFIVKRHWRVLPGGGDGGRGGWLKSHNN